MSAVTLFDLRQVVARLGPNLAQPMPRTCASFRPMSGAGPPGVVSLATSWRRQSGKEAELRLELRFEPSAALSQEWVDFVVNVSDYVVLHGTQIWDARLIKAIMCSIHRYRKYNPKSPNIILMYDLDDRSAVRPVHPVSQDHFAAISNIVHQVPLSSGGASFERKRRHRIKSFFTRRSHNGTIDLTFDHHTKTTKFPSATSWTSRSLATTADNRNDQPAHEEVWINDYDSAMVKHMAEVERILRRAWSDLSSAKHLPAEAAWCLVLRLDKSCWPERTKERNELKRQLLSLKEGIAVPRHRITEGMTRKAFVDTVGAAWKDIQLHGRFDHHLFDYRIRQLV